jgi:hypothetical protein
MGHIGENRCTGGLVRAFENDLKGGLGSARVHVELKGSYAQSKGEKLKPSKIRMFSILKYSIFRFL